MSVANRVIFDICLAIIILLKAVYVDLNVGMYSRTAEYRLW